MSPEHPTDPPADPGPRPAALRALDDLVPSDRLRMAVAELVADAQRAQQPRWRRGGLPRRGALR
ncbi:MAG TPA: hypothetical protein VN635_14220, partial [Conexibacter sp.]|nr:hypothetical protein [Conexibacter sp.]